MNEIAQTCKELSDLRAQLRRRHETMQRNIRVIEAEHTPELRRIQEQCSTTRGYLEQLVERARPDFTKKKSAEFHGITVGFAKSRDTIELPEGGEPVVVDRIEKMLPAKVGETVLDRSVHIIKGAFSKLLPETLMRLGCKIISGADKAFVRAKDDDIEALVQKSLGEAKSEVEHV